MLLYDVQFRLAGHDVAYATTTLRLFVGSIPATAFFMPFQSVDASPMRKLLFCRPIGVGWAAWKCFTRD